MLAGVNFWASRLVVVKVLSVGDLVASCASSQLWLDLPGDLARFVLRDSALHKVCCHCQGPLLRLRAEGCGLARLGGLTSCDCGLLLLRVQLMLAAGAVWRRDAVGGFLAAPLCCGSLIVLVGHGRAGGMLIHRTGFTDRSTCRSLHSCCSRSIVLAPQYLLLRAATILSRLLG